jgi:phage terminase small subunit
MPLATGWSAPFAPRSNFKPGDDSFVSFAAIQGSDGKPPEPVWRTIFSNEDDLAIATEAWGFVVRELGEAGTLALANGHAIRRLVEFRVQYERASRQVAERGALLPPSNKKTKVGQWNPYWSVMRQAGAEITALEAELGIAPVRRGKAVKVQRGKKAPRPADAYLKPVPGEPAG